MSRPYLEVKIIEEEKVKGKRELEMNPRGAGKSTKYWSNFSNEVLERLQINAKRELGRRQAGKAHKQGERSGGNNVNGENIQKIKFPCFCSFVKDGEKRYGEINTNYNEHKEELEYELSDITQQVDGKMMGSSFSVRYSDFSLEDLIKCHDVHIKRGKIIIFDEEKNK